LEKEKNHLTKQQPQANSQERLLSAAPIVALSAKFYLLQQYIKVAIMNSFPVRLLSER